MSILWILACRTLQSPWCIGLLGLGFAFLLAELLNSGLGQLTVEAVGWLLELNKFNVTVAGDSIMADGMTMRVTPACLGLIPIFLAAVALGYIRKRGRIAIGRTLAWFWLLLLLNFARILLAVFGTFSSGNHFLWHDCFLVVYWASVVVLVGRNTTAVPMALSLSSLLLITSCRLASQTHATPASASEIPPTFFALPVDSQGAPIARKAVKLKSDLSHMIERELPSRFSRSGVPSFCGVAGYLLRNNPNNNADADCYQVLMNGTVLLRRSRLERDRLYVGDSYLGPDGDLAGHCMSSAILEAVANVVDTASEPETSASLLKSLRFDKRAPLNE